MVAGAHRALGMHLRPSSCRALWEWIRLAGRGGGEGGWTIILRNKEQDLDSRGGYSGLYGEVCTFSAGRRKTLGDFDDVSVGTGMPFWPPSGDGRAG